MANAHQAYRKCSFRIIGQGIIVEQLLAKTLLLSYHRRQSMISEVLLLRVEGGRVSLSWCMGVVRLRFVVHGCSKSPVRCPWV